MFEPFESEAIKYRMVTVDEYGKNFFMYRQDSSDVDVYGFDSVKKCTITLPEAMWKDTFVGKANLDGSGYMMNLFR